MSRIARVAWAMGLVSLLSWSVAWAQPESDAPAADDASAEEAPAEEDAAEESPAEERAAEEKAAENAPAAEDADPAETGDDAQEGADEKEGAAETPAGAGDPAGAADFDTLFDNWKKTLAGLRELQLLYKATAPADDDKRKELEGRFDKLIAEGTELIPKLKQAAEASYLAGNKTQPVSNFLVSMVRQDLGRDDNEEALRRARVLLENGYDNKQLTALAGVAAFNLSQFDAAEKFLKEADEAAALDEKAQRYLGMVEDYKEKWARELELREQEDSAPDAEKLPQVELKTSKGDIVVELFENEAPIATANFISLVETKFYDGTPFHRVLPGFMAQGGDPQGKGTGGPGYTIPCECYQENRRTHFRGSLSMAHAGRDTGGSQFFLTFAPVPHLDGKHTVFGRVVSGMDVLGKLQRIDPDKPGEVEPDKIETATVLRKRDHAYVPKKNEDEAAGTDANPPAEKKGDKEGDGE